ncbi:MAG: hypothetical protein NC310_05830 [Roseburia sp.]|nr:hypothetical protein [Anaeroplasma bactoclasticum]MCM1196569.1 hypothetical protein [Roseburia sp.]MCM1557602.1 hypothetical protein [Anaeroplasma bactoclasticum]
MTALIIPPNVISAVNDAFAYFAPTSTTHYKIWRKPKSNKSEVKLHISSFVVGTHILV